jgi:hypothetical protein
MSRWRHVLVRLKRGLRGAESILRAVFNLLRSRERDGVTAARRGLAVEALENRQLLAGLPVITEFMASNDGTLEDADGGTPDWIEIQNAGDTVVDLAGYRLTDKPDNLFRWTFPSVRLEPGEYLVVFASGRDDGSNLDAAGNLHTNFALSAAGEYLALVGPDGAVLSEFGSAETAYPEQHSNISYGVAQRKMLLDEQSDATFWVPLSDKVDPDWTQLAFDARRRGFSSGRAAMGYEGSPEARNNFASEIHTTLPPWTHAVYARFEFDVPRASEISRLTLNLKYDDGFVAYLNGTKVAEAYAPSNPQWFSSATGRLRQDKLALTFQQFDLARHVNRLVNGTNVLAVHGLNNMSDLSDMLLVPQLVAARNSPLAKTGYMPSPTPGAENVAEEGVYLGFVAPAEFSAERGMYDEPFDLTVTSPTSGSLIRYTTDGRAPTATTGTVYTGPIPITTTTTLRAAAFKDSYIPSPVLTQTYLFLADVIRQPGDPAGFPATWQFPADYEMDPRIVYDPAYADEIIEGLQSIRTMSIVMDPDDLFGPEGIYSNTAGRGEGWQRPASVEMIHPDGSLTFQADAGIRIHGNSTRDAALAKHSFRLEFQSQYGPTALEYPLFLDAPADRFDSIVVRAGLMQVDPQLLRDTFARDTARDMGKLDAHATYVHLYLNGLYWGLYNPFERPDAQFAEEYFGGEASDYDSISTGEVIDGGPDRYRALLALIASGLSTPEAYAELERQVDLDNLIDFILINQYMASGENEWRAIGNRAGDANFRFFVWDMDEQSLNRINARNDISRAFPAGVYDQLSQHPEFRMRFADRAHKHLLNGGALTPQAVTERWETRAQEIYSAVIAETARWGDVNRSQPFTRDAGWHRDLARLVGEYFPQRTQVVIEQLRGANLYPTIEAPRFHQHGGPVAPYFQLVMDHPNATGTILFTLDGTDPREPGGAIAPGARLYHGSPVTITSDTMARARVFSQGEWSALNQAEFFILGPDSPFHLRVTEINYNPHDANPAGGLGEANVDNDQFEYIELANTGQAAIDISGFQLAGAVKFTFPTPATLAPGEHVLAVKNLAAFRSRYGDRGNVAGEFHVGTLSNGAGLVQVRDAGGRLVQSLRYGTQAPWPERADGGGSSLELVDPLGPTGPDNWRTSSQFGGSPGAPGLEPDRRIVFSEVLAHSRRPGSNMVELHNTTATPVDISNWYVSNAQENYFLYQLPKGTTIPAGGYHVLTESQMGFGFRSWQGDQLWLLKADEHGKPLGFVDHVVFGPSGQGVSMGPSPNGDKAWLPMAWQTFGRANSRVLLGDIIISEVHYGPQNPDGDLGQLSADDFEYVELYNRSDTAVDLTGWRLTGGINMTLPQGTLIGAEQTLVVVSFDTADAVKSSIFRFVFGIDPRVPLVGPYDGTLEDDGDLVRLERPDDPPAEQPAFTPYLYVDEINYRGTAPWPHEAAGSGVSLHRALPVTLGNFPTSWAADVPSPGAIDFVVRHAGDATGDGQFDQSDIFQILQTKKYLAGEPARWEQGDWNGDGVFDSLDIVAALQTGKYRHVHHATMDA